MNDEVDMRRYGGLRTVMPVTFATFGVGYLAIIGVPFLSGWWTKEGIIQAAFDSGGLTGQILGWVTVLGAGLTAFYMSRIMFLTFFGTKRWAKDANPHESPAVMTVPMIILAIGSAALGAVLVVNYTLANFLAPVVGAPAHEFDLVHMLTSPYSLAALVLMIVGVAYAWVRYANDKVPVTHPRATSSRSPPGRSCTATPSTKACSCGPASSSPGPPSPSTTTVSTVSSPGSPVRSAQPRRTCGSPRPGSPAATR